ncbi:MAG TPA: hypothetical protein DEA75_15595 [Rhodobacteraceae bacterium]|jgi:hypothetical protein|nr:hypothetical protein [Paracoccaceae bacterium]
MGSRAKISGVRLTEYDAALVKGMLARGDRQHDIAAWFGLNGGRIAEVATGVTFAWVHQETVDLPPSGPYPTGKQAAEAQAALDQALNALALAKVKIGAITRATI